MRTIYLIGFMGSGKTSVGEFLAKELNKSFIDTDQYIERKHGKIREIFTKHGEETFRSYEIQALKETMDYGVVATGGGIIEKEENHETMKQNGFIVYLETSFQTIDKRLKNDKNRPLWKEGLKQNKKRYEERIPIYEEICHYRIQTDGKNVGEIAFEIIRNVRE